MAMVVGNERMPSKILSPPEVNVPTVMAAGSEKVLQNLSSSLEVSAPMAMAAGEDISYGSGPIG